MTQNRNSVPTASEHRGRPLLRGVLSPVVTPFQADLSPDPARFVAHCRWLLDNGCDGLAVFGTNSEANSLDAHERMTLLDHLVGHGLDAGRMLPGTGCCSLPETVRLTRHAVAHGCAGVLMLPPFFYKGLTDVVLGDLPPGWEGPFLVGTVAAALAGFLAISVLLTYVRRHTYTVFVVYRLAVAAFVLLLIATGVREATF